MAHALHKHSPRRAKPFIALNMAAIPKKDLIETELFGHEKVHLQVQTPSIKDVLNKPMAVHYFLMKLVICLLKPKHVYSVCLRMASSTVLVDIFQ